MRVISENSEEHLKRRDADRELQYALRSFAANLIRVIRGAGKPYEIDLQVKRMTDALNIYFVAFGHLPMPDAYANHLGISKDASILRDIPTEERLRVYAEEGIIRASLQIVASRLLGQKTHESAAENDFYSSIFNLDEARSMQRKKFVEEVKAAKVPRKRRAKAKKPISKNG